VLRRRRERLLVEGGGEEIAGHHPFSWLSFGLLSHTRPLVLTFKSLQRSRNSAGRASCPASGVPDPVISHLFTYWLAEQRSPVLAVGVILLQRVLLDISWRTTRTLAFQFEPAQHLRRFSSAGPCSHAVGS
jgi:hypothetical protein